MGDELTGAGIAGQLAGARRAVVRHVVPRGVLGLAVIEAALDRDGQVVGGRVLQRQATEEFLLAGAIRSDGGVMRGRGEAVCNVSRGVGAHGRNVVVVAAVHLAAAQREAHAEGVAQRARGDELAHVLLRLELVARLGDEFALAARIVGGERDHAGGRVLAEEQRLRPLQHFDAFEVEEAFLDDAALAVVGTIDDDGDRLFDADRGRRRTDAAHGELRARAVRGATDAEVRRRRRDLLDRGDVALLDDLFRDRGHGHGNGLHRFLALARGDDDFFETACRSGVTGLRFLRVSEIGAAEHARCQQQSLDGALHSVPP